MSGFLQKIKQLGFYKLGFFAIIGIAVVLLLGSVVLSSLNSTRSIGTVGISGSITNPLSAPSYSVTDFFEAPSAKKGSIAPQAVRAEEGQLTQRKIIKDGLLSLLVKKVEDSIQNIQALAKTMGGFVGSLQVYEASDGTKSGNITIRVPADRFEEALAAVKNFAVKVERENVTAQDVTETFIDLEARLKNLEAQEIQYLEILKRAFSIEDILNVQQRLGDVRGQIEQIQGQIQFLSRQVDMSTITVSMISEADIQVLGIRWRPLFVVKQSFYNMMSGLAGYVDSMIAFIFFLPRLILWLATIFFLIYICWRIIKWLRQKFFPPRDTSA